MIPPLASNFVAGESATEVLEHVDRLNTKGVAGICNLLGEHYDDPARATADTNAYLDLIEQIDHTDLDACVSVKPSQIGLDVDESVFTDNLTAIASKGAAHGVFVWVDMEDYTTTDATLDVFESLVRSHGGGMGLCLQVNLNRTREDLERLADAPGKIRLVKGAYNEPRDVSIRDKERIDERYRELLEYMFEHFDGGIGVGSHDPAMIDHARRLHEEYGTPYEVQMLTGVREKRQYELAAAGVTVYQYIPYGTKWLSYFYRRLRERKGNLLFALRAIFS